MVEVAKEEKRTPVGGDKQVGQDKQVEWEAPAVAPLAWAVA